MGEISTHPVPAEALYSSGPGFRIEMEREVTPPPQEEARPVSGGGLT